MPTARTQLYNNVFLDSTILNLASGGSERVRGAFGFRATMVFTLQVVTTPFEQGVLVLSFQYYNGSDYWRGREVASCTNIPHVRLDVSENTMVQLKVPFMSNNDFTLITSNENYGKLLLSTLAPVGPNDGAYSPRYNIYYHLEDLELFGVVPQDVIEWDPLLGRAIASASTNVDFQGGGRAVEKEFDDESRPYSSGLYSLSKTLSWISKGIPYLSSFSAPASWFTEKLAGAVRSFGFARPQTVDPPMRTQNLMSIMENNVDVPATIEVLAPFASNHLAVTPAFGGTDVDEMSIAYVVSQYNQVYYGTIANTVATGTVVYVQSISPLGLFFKDDFSVISPGAALVQPSNIMWLGTMFKYWRGGLRFRFTFVKSKMHAGRVLCSFIPSRTRFYDPYIPDVDGVGVQTDGYMALFDLKDSNVFEFDVPYPSNLPYIRTSCSSADGNWVESTGTLSLTLVDEISAPAICQPYVSLVVEVCGMPDTQFACPVGPNFTPDLVSPVTFQSGAVATAYEDEICTLTMGEWITSLKQLIMIPKSTAFSGFTSTGTPISSLFDLPPWYYQPTDADARETHSYGGVLSHGYTYVKGSTDHHIIGDSRGTSFFRAFPHDSSVSNLTDVQSTSSLPMLFSSVANTSLHFRMPSYQRSVRLFARGFDSIHPAWSLVPGGASFTSNFFFANTPDVSGGVATTVPRIGFFDIGGVTVNPGLLIRRQAGDDAGMAHFIGPPLIRRTIDLDTPVAGY